MTSLLPQITQFLAWLVALIALIMSMYVLLLNYRRATNRYISLLLFVLAMNSFAIGSLPVATSAAQARLPAILLAVTTPAIQPILLISSIYLFKPQLLSGARRWLLWILGCLALAPAILALIDVLWWYRAERGLAFLYGSPLYFTGVGSNYTGGYLTMNDFASGPANSVINALNFSLLGLAAIVFLFYIALGDRSVPPRVKRVALVLGVVNILAAVISMALGGGAEFPLATLFAGALFIVAYSYAAFEEIIGGAEVRGGAEFHGGVERPSEQRMIRGSLPARLTALTVIVSAPLLIAIALFLTNRARLQIETDALRSLNAASHSLADTSELWLDFNIKALQSLVQNPGIISMEPASQKPLLESMAAAYPHMYLVSTTGTDGVNIARNDDETPKDYSDRIWVQSALAGAELTYQTLIGRTSGQPALVISMPIRDASGTILGVGMFASDLDDISHLVEHSELGEGGFTYVVDENNLVVAHPDPAQTAALKDMSQAPPVVALRRGHPGPISFTDEDGRRWRADFASLPNGWGVVAQQSEAQLLAPIRTFQGMALIASLVGIGMLVVMTLSTIRHNLRPIESLTATAAAIQAGEMTRLAPIESQDELGLLAETFNAMTTQLRELVSGLEGRVAERTQALERRALQLQVTAEVAREAAAIRDLEQLLDNVVRLISDRFGFYHAGIFLLSGSERESGPTAGYAVLRAASSPGGKRMLARHHRLRVGRVGIVGYVAAAGLPRIALDVGADAVYFDNPDLPETRSEMALPLLAQERVIGVLDVQSKKPSAFSDDDVAILQILADQIALAIENARLLRESQQALHELQIRYGRQVSQGWQKQLSGQPLIYSYDPSGVKPGEADKSRTADQGEAEPGKEVYLPIELRGQRLGYLRLRRPPDAGSWTSEERELLRETLDQLALSLENARLLEEIQDRARQEELINQIISRAQSSLNLEAVMRNTVQEVGRMMNLSGLQLRLNEAAPITRPTPARQGPPVKPGGPSSEEPPHRTEP